MADFSVKVVKINKVEKLENSDRLSVAHINGWQCVIQRNAYNEGDLAVYIPIDSILPQKIEEILFGTDAKVKLSKSRVRTIKLRGAISQGMLAPCSELGVPEKEGYDCTAQLGITKFEPPPPPANMCSGANPVSKKKKNPNFKEYGGLDNFKHHNRLFQDDEPVVITEKIHGCLEARTKIKFVDGSTHSIKDIVNNKIQGEVWGINSFNELIPTRILNWFDNGKTENWKYLKFSRKNMEKGNYFGKIICTSNHKFFNPITKEYVRADQLMVGDKLLAAREKLVLSFVQSSILIGKMLGDATLASNAICFGHKKEHESYIDDTLASLGFIAGNKQKEQTSGFGTVMIRSRTIANTAINELFESWLVNGIKVVPANLSLNPISLAYWFMDDGSLGHHPSQEDRALFATCGFDEISVDNLIRSMLNLGIDGVKYQSDGYWRIRLNADEAEKLFVIIAPYVSECMRYKLPERYRDVPYVNLRSSNSYKSVLLEQEVLEIRDTTETEISNHSRFDIETETHNFIANGVVVHNSNFRAGIVPVEINTFLKKMQKALGILRPYEFVYGSNKVQLQHRLDSGSKWKIKLFGWIPIKSVRTLCYQGYYAQSGVGNVYAEAVAKYSLKTRLEEGEVLYGEIYGDGIQGGYTYGCKPGEHKLVVFDVMINGEYMDHDELEYWCADRGLECVPVLYRGPFSEKIARELTKGNSVFAPTQKVREGVVIRPEVETKCHIGRKILKLISDDYLLKEDNTDFH